MDTAVVSKGDFAKLIGVSPGRVSQMIADGMIGADALVGEGRMAKVNVSLASAQIKSRRDVGQSLGNGLGTKLDPVAADPSSMLHIPVADYTREPRAPAEPSTQDQIALERLAAERRRNRQAEENDALRRGELMETHQARIEMGKIANSMLQVFEGALPEMATALAAKFELSQRDVLHELRQRFVEMRKVASEREAKRSADLPEQREMVL